jgi:hypothetical protein
VCDWAPWLWLEPDDGAGEGAGPAGALPLVPAAGGELAGAPLSLEPFELDAPPSAVVLPVALLALLPRLSFL